MERQILLFMLAVGAIILLVACAVRGEMEGLLTVLMRGLLGAVGIHFVNATLAMLGISLSVGMNFFTLLTIGFLGIPGFLGLYALGFYHLL